MEKRSYGNRGRREETSEDLRSEEHTSELQSHSDLVCRLLLEKNGFFDVGIWYLAGAEQNLRPEIPRCFF